MKLFGLILGVILSIQNSSANIGEQCEELKSQLEVETVEELSELYDEVLKSQSKALNPTIKPFTGIPGFSNNPITKKTKTPYQETEALRVEVARLRALTINEKRLEKVEDINKEIEKTENSITDVRKRGEVAKKRVLEIQEIIRKNFKQQKFFEEQVEEFQRVIDLYHTGLLFDNKEWNRIKKLKAHSKNKLQNLKTALHALDSKLSYAKKVSNPFNIGKSIQGLKREISRLEIEKEYYSNPEKIHADYITKKSELEEKQRKFIKQTMIKQLKADPKALDLLHRCVELGYKVNSSTLEKEIKRNDTDEKYHGAGKQ
jgi:hypothetical protein